MKANRKDRRRRAGFTLLEVMIVVAILVMLAAFAVPNLLGMQDKAKIDMTKSQVKQFYESAKLYKQQSGEFPSGGEGLNVLSTGPAGATDWRPIMSSEEVNAVDPWGNKYQYQYPGSRNPYGASHPDVWSNGPDRQSGTGDDIGNWSSRK